MMEKLKQNPSAGSSVAYNERIRILPVDYAIK
jgi:hypothetical protein